MSDGRDGHDDPAGPPDAEADALHGSEGSHGSHGPDDSTDELLRSAGTELRASAPHMDGHQMVVARLEAGARRARLTSIVAVGVAAALLAAMVGFVLTDDQPAEFAAGSGGAAPGGAAPGVAESIVADLPPQPVDPHDVELVASVKRFDSCDALADDLRTVGAAHVGSTGFGSQTGLLYPGGRAATFGGDEAAPADAGVRNAGPANSMIQTGGSGDGETLGTNVIVEGVDEPDTVKAWGSLVVDLSGQQLRVIDTAAGSVVGSMELGMLPGGDDGDEDEGDDGHYAYPASLLFEGDRVIVFGTESEPADAVPGDPSAARPSVQYTTVTFVDVSDPANPTETDRVRMEGNLVAARRVEGEVRIVTGSSMQDLPLVNPTNPSSVPVALEQNRLAVAGSSVDDWIPAWDRGEGTDPQRLVDCNQVVVPDTFAGVQMTSLVAFDLQGPFGPRAAGILAPSDDITATATDVVVASHIWVDPADRAEGFEDWSSALHRFSFTDDLPAYEASGKVEGSIRDDFSLSVLDESAVGVLTVDVLPWEQREEAKVTVRILGRDGEVMPEVGTLDLAKGGAGTAGMRFMGDRLIVSSGLAGNHLSVVELSNREAPRSTGEVDIEGSGAYFHPLEDDRVLVVGQAWRTIGFGENAYPAPRDLSVTVVDLSGPPAVVSTLRTPNTFSDVGADHHGFTWWPARSAAAFGVTHTSENPRDVAPSPEAMFVSVGGADLQPLLVRPSEADLGPRCPWEQQDRTGCDDTGPPRVDRVLVVDGQVWLHTSESLEHLDVGSDGPITAAASVAMIPLPPPR